MRPAETNTNPGDKTMDATQQIVTITASGKTYDARKSLRRAGFIWDADEKVWTLQGYHGTSTMGQPGTFDPNGNFLYTDREQQAWESDGVTFTTR